MKKLTTFLTLALTSLLSVGPLTAATFEESQLDQSSVIAVARPLGENKYDLLVIEQIKGKQQCWSESGSTPVVIEPLLLNFDFTGHCNRATDSNGYSIRIDGQDYGLDYLMSLVVRDGDVFLVGKNRSNPSQEIVLGRSGGIANGFLKIQLYPGWQFSKRTYKGKTLGHFYFSGTQAALANGGSTPPPLPGGASGSGFRDIGNDIYRTQIEQAVALGFIAGFKEDNTFRPNDALTREQLVSMAIEAINTVQKVNLDDIPSGAVSPFRDVDNSRWSAKKIKWAQANQIVAGKPDGTFAPTQPITRAELMAVLRRMTEYLHTKQGLSAQLKATKTPVEFSDINGHWANDLVLQMSAYCGVASPLNERGTAFAPNEPAKRNYAAAAMVRALDCVKTETSQKK